jgi:hypothetical protein
MLSSSPFSLLNELIEQLPQLLNLLFMEPILQPPGGTIQRWSQNDHQIWRRIPSICSCPNVRF